MEGNGGGKGRDREEGMEGFNQNALYAYASVHSQIVQKEKSFCWGGNAGLADANDGRGFGVGK